MFIKGRVWYHTPRTAPMAPHEVKPSDTPEGTKIPSSPKSWSGITEWIKEKAFPSIQRGNQPLEGKCQLSTIHSGLWVKQFHKVCKMETSLLSRNNTNTTRHYFRSLNFFALIWSQEFWEGQTLSPFHTDEKTEARWGLTDLPSCQLDLIHGYLKPNMYLSAQFPTQTCSSSLPHFNTRHHHCSSCSGQKPWCSP